MALKQKRVVWFYLYKNLLDSIMENGKKITVNSLFQLTGVDKYSVNCVTRKKKIVLRIFAKSLK